MIPRLFLTMALSLITPALSFAGQTGGTGSGGVNAAEQLDKPYLLLVSIDGFRWDFADLQDTPAIDRIAENGLKADALQPVFPTLTFPNHFSIATGVRPASHGIVANDFPNEDGSRWYRYKDRSSVQDGQWYLAEPIWVTAEKQGMVTAAYFFVGTEADVAGVRPTHWRPFDASISGEERVAQVLSWLSEPPETRPHLITLYFEEVDVHTHSSGPGSAESLQAIRRVDAQVQRLLDGIESLPHGNEVYVLLVSDHGQASYNPMRDVINEHWTCGRAMLPTQSPPAWNMGSSARYPDLIVLADPGCSVLSTADKQNKINTGAHGWSPEMPEMRGIFYAMGPRIPRGIKIGIVDATDIYPLMLSILGLTAPHAMEGDPDKLPSLLLPAQ
jgi:predicted AlkP superfamily pyrophosphatase or phosphodiesterase